jgi:hypothetical protein
LHEDCSQAIRNPKKVLLDSEITDKLVLCLLPKRLENLTPERNNINNNIEERKT